jgi:hypothetical protein
MTLTSKWPLKLVLSLLWEPVDSDAPLSEDFLFILNTMTHSFKSLSKHMVPSKLEIHWILLLFVDLYTQKCQWTSLKVAFKRWQNQAGRSFVEAKNLRGQETLSNLLFVRFLRIRILLCNSISVLFSSSRNLRLWNRQLPTIIRFLKDFLAVYLPKTSATFLSGLDLLVQIAELWM